jgi:predicted aspartyl protease
VALSSVAWANSTPNSPDQLAPHAPQKTIPIRLYRGFLVVAEGQFGSVLEHQNLLLDTGTSPSIINIDLAASLGLTKTSAILAALGKNSEVQGAILPEIEIGPIRVDSLPVVLSDLSRLEKDLGIPIAGVIGLDVLSRATFRLDYEKKSIEFGKFTQGGITVPLLEGSSIALAEVNWGGTSVRMLVDTGSDQLVLLGKQHPLSGFLSAALTGNGKTGSDSAGRTKTAASVADRLTVQELPSAEIVLAGKKFSHAKAYWVPGSDTSDFEGLLGVRSLGFRLFSFDREHRTIHLSQ